MHPEQSSEQGARRRLRRAGRWVVALFWTIQFLELSVVAAIQGRSFALHRLPERLLLVGLGMVLTLGLLEFAARLEGRPFRARLVGTVLAALLLSGLMVGVSWFTARLSIAAVQPFDPVSFVYNGFSWSWFFLSVAAAILALSYSMEAGARDKRVAMLEVAARDARIAALRYQINPHFLFNALNSIAALIDEGRHRAAEDMVESLSDFLRTTLELDPVEDVTLGREFELQALYLSIEQARFPRRLEAVLDLPEDLRGAVVPALITQPLVENVIRHTVARSTGLVRARIAAECDGEDVLTIVVEDDGGTATGPASPGTGLGIANVRARLQARFGPAQSVRVLAPAGGGHRVELSFPRITR